MGDDSERLHLEGLDEATERERWEEHHASPTDLPDAVVELTDDEIKTLAQVASGVSPRKRPGDWEYSFPHDALLAAVESIITDRLAAASGPWAEQLDTARPRYDYEILGNHDADFLQLQADFDAQNDALAAALARNAELEERLTQIDANGGIADLFTERDHWRKTAESISAELDNLRETLAQKIEAEGKKVVQWLADTRSDATDMGRLIGTEDAYKHAAALVRGSDDEAKP